MMDIKVVYEESGEDGMMNPVWMIIDCRKLEWDKILYIDIHTPFERLTFDEIDSERFAVTVPDTAYIRHKDKEFVIGINLPATRSSAFSALHRQPRFEDFDLSSIDRLVLRIGDIEEALQYEIRSNLKY